MAETAAETAEKEVSLPQAEDKGVGPSQPAPSGSEAISKPQDSEATANTSAQTSAPKPKKKYKPRTKDSAASAASNSLDGGQIGVPTGDNHPPGWYPAGGGQRRALPEAVLPFKLPTLTAEEQAERAASLSSEDDEEDDSEDSDEDEDEEEDSDDSQGRGRNSKRRRGEAKQHRQRLILSQSLRQSRLFYLSSILPPHSIKTKTGVSFFDRLPASSIHGMKPNQSGTCALAQLGKVEIQMGPHVFAGTRLFEMVKDRSGPQRGSKPVAGPSASNASGNSPASDKSKGKAKQATKPRTSATTSKETNTSKGPSASVSASASSSARRSPSATPAPRPPAPTPPSAAATAAVDPALVARVNAKAAKSAELRDLLQIAARGAASPEQLKILGGVIQQVTREMEAEGIKVQVPRPNKPLPQPAMKPSPSSSVLGPDAAQKKAASGTQKTAQKKLSTAEKSASSSKEADQAPGPTSGEAAASQQALEAPKSSSPSSTAAPAQAPPPHSAAQTVSSSKTPAASVPPLPPSALNRPPVLVVEFKETPTMRYYLPCWQAIVHRRKVRMTRSEVAAIQDGYDGYVEAEEWAAEPRHKLQEPMVDVPVVEMKFVGPVEGSDAATASSSSQIPLIMTITGGEDPSRYMWDAFGRIPGIKTYDHYGYEVMEEARPATSASQPADTTTENQGQATDQQQEATQSHEQLTQQIQEAIAQLPPRLWLDLDGPVPSGLEDHLADKFAPQVVHAFEGEVEAARGRRGAGTTKRKYSRRVPRNAFDVGLDDSMASFGTIGGGDDSILSQSMDGGIAPREPRRPAKRRNVATHNPDGSIKMCEYCSTTSTPMWRRGPSGASSLCNACGARWKVGRLEAVAPEDVRSRGANAANSASKDSQARESQAQSVDRDGDRNNAESTSMQIGQDEGQASKSEREAGTDAPVTEAAAPIST